MADAPRLIEHAFPLKQASLDSVHEKNVRHGHISTLHIWPARRPLAACRAALIATLLPDPSAQPKPEGMSDEEWHKEIIRRRKELCEKIGGKVVKKIERKKMPNGQIVEREKEITEGGILHWGRETENRETLEWFRQEIRKAYGGRAPKVLDPFAGGGAIPLEAMRLGCEATAVDINPVAWFILKCTLEYPQKLAGKTLPLPEFILENEEFMNACYKAHPHLTGRTKHTRKQQLEFSQNLFMKDKPDSGRVPKADLAWHVRAWGHWVLDHARRELARFYPVYADFESLTRRDAASTPFQKQPMRLVPIKEDGTPDIDALNGEFSDEYLADTRNPRWIAKPTVAYLWARTVQCKNCRAIIPLLKTRWLCKKDGKRVLLTIDAASVDAASRRVDSNTRRDAASTIYFDPDEPIDNMSGNLPHWRKPGAMYSVTFRLADSMPEEKLRQWTEERDLWMKAHPEPHDERARREYFRLFPARFQEWLDAGHGECLLARQDVKELVGNSLKFFVGSRYNLDRYVVMPNHVHALVQPLADYSLSEVTHSWKSYTAHEINKMLGRSGTLWQKESFDHIVRGPEQLERFRDYMRDNPGKVEAASRRLDTRRDVASTIFGIRTNVPITGGNTAQRREHDRRLGAGTMSRSGAKCTCCGTIMEMEDIRLEGQSGRLGAINTAVVVDGQDGKEYRLPTIHEIRMPDNAGENVSSVFKEIPFGLPDEPLPSKEALGFRVPLYGFDQWSKLFTSRQLVALGTILKWTRASNKALPDAGYSPLCAESISAYLSSMFDRLSNQLSNLSRWNQGGEKIEGTFARFALPILWDFAECNPLGETSGGYPSAFGWVTMVVDHLCQATLNAPHPKVVRQSAIRSEASEIDCIITDPPYYDTIPYSDLMDYFYVWLRRCLNGLYPNIDNEFNERLTPKWDPADNDGELIDDASRHDGDRRRSKAVYEDGMARVFKACHRSLSPGGQLVIVFAHKHPDAWETLVSAIIRAGFVVDGSWPIQTERVTRTRAISSAALASSVWLVCKKRSIEARPGWDNQVLEEMRENIREKLREFWDAGIRGPDFVWAATGPALEAFSKHPVVKKANEPGPMTVSEFLIHVRRMVVDFVVGRVLSRSAVSALDPSGGDAPSTLDAPTAYYLLHRHDFGVDEAPAGACILYAISCGISDKELAGTWDLIGFTKGKSAEEVEDEESDADAESDPDVEEDSGSRVKLKTWALRKSRSLGYEAPGGKPIPLIDRIHCLMHLWKGGDLFKVDEYLDGNGLRRQELFKRLLQSLIELSPRGSEERSLLESLSNHVQARGAVREAAQAILPLQHEES